VVSVRSFFPAMMVASFGLLYDLLVNLLSAFLAKERKSPTQIAKIWNRILIKAREASIEKADSQFVVQFTVGPTFDVLKHHTAQQPIRRNPCAANFTRAWRAARQSPSAQSQ
jgi:hypothetical protein